MQNDTATTTQPSHADAAPGDDQPSTDAQLSPDDVRSIYARASALTTDVLAAIEPAQYDLRTPCETMTVAELCEHLVMVQRRVACAGRDVPVQEWPIDAADVPAGEWAAAFAEASHDVQASWPAEVLDRPTALPWGTFPGRDALAIYVNELIVHAWDLAQPTGLEPAWEDEVLLVADASIHAQLPDADRRAMWDQFAAMLPDEVEWEDPFGNAVPVPDDAPLIDRLVAWNGRQP